MVHEYENFTSNGKVMGFHPLLSYFFFQVSMQLLKLLRSLCRSLISLITACFCKIQNLSKFCSSRIDMRHFKKTTQRLSFEFKTKPLCHVLEMSNTKFVLQNRQKVVKSNQNILHYCVSIKFSNWWTMHSVLLDIPAFVALSFGLAEWHWAYLL